MIEKFIELIMDLIESGKGIDLCSIMICPSNAKCENCPVNEENLKKFLNNLNNMSKIEKLMKEI